MHSMRSNPTYKMDESDESKDAQLNVGLPSQLSYVKPNSRYQLLRFGIFAYNLTIWVFGGAILGIGIWMAVDRSFLTYIIGIDTYSVAIYMVLVGGGLVFIMAFLGCCGAIVMSRCMLWTFMIALAFLALVMFIGGIIAIAFRFQINASVQQSMENSLINYYGVDLQNYYNRQVTQAWDRAQERLFCCGVGEPGYAAYRQTRWYKLYGAIDTDGGYRHGYEDLKPYVPRSCCVRDRFYRYINTEVCQKWRMGAPGSSSVGAINRALYEPGCYNAAKQYLVENSGILIALGLSMAFLLAFGVVLTYFLLKYAPKDI